MILITIACLLFIGYGVAVGTSSNRTLGTTEQEKQIHYRIFRSLLLKKIFNFPVTYYFKPGINVFIMLTYNFCNIIMLGTINSYNTSNDRILYNNWYYFIFIEFKRQFDRRGYYVPVLRIHTWDVGLAVRVLRHRGYRNGVVFGMVVARVRYALATPLHFRSWACAHH